MSYKRFKPAPKPATQQTIATFATIAGVPRPYIPLARTPPIAKFNNNNNIYNKGLRPFEPASLPEKATEPPAPMSVYADRGPAIVAKVAIVCEPAPPPICASTPATVATVSAYRSALTEFKEHRPHGFTRFRHDQACWVGEMFLNQWGAMAAEFGWLVGDIFGPHGLAWWLGVEVVRTLGPEHAIVETNRVYDRVTHADWLAVYGAPESKALQ